MSPTIERSRSRPGRLVASLAAAATVVLLAACGSSAGSDGGTAGGSGGADAQPVAVSKASLVPGQQIPVPPGAPALTVTGELSGANHRGTVELDVATLNAMGLVQVEVYEPWEKERLSFRAVDLADVLAVAGIGRDATSLHLTALDDYEVDLTMDEIRTGGILVATQTGSGQPLPVENGGPSRIIFTDGTKAGAASEQWIWSLKSIEVR